MVSTECLHKLVLFTYIPSENITCFDIFTWINSVSETQPLAHNHLLDKYVNLRHQ